MKIGAYIGGCGKCNSIGCVECNGNKCNDESFANLKLFTCLTNKEKSVICGSEINECYFKRGVGFKLSVSYNASF